MGSCYRFAQVVTDLQTSCNKVVVKPISGCVRLFVVVVVKSGTSCCHHVTRLMPITDLLQVVPTRL